jgi:hypothetical protein
MDTFPFSDVGLSSFPLLNVAWETSAETSDKLNCIGPNTWFQVSIIRVDQRATKCPSFNGFIAKPLLNSPDLFSGQRRGLLEMSETNRPKFQRLPTLTSQESPPAAKVGNTPKCKQHMISFRPHGERDWPIQNNAFPNRRPKRASFSPTMWPHPRWIQSLGQARVHNSISALVNIEISLDLWMFIYTFNKV